MQTILQQNRKVKLKLVQNKKYLIQQKKYLKKRTKKIFKNNQLRRKHSKIRILKKIEIDIHFKYRKLFYIIYSKNHIEYVN